MSNITNEDLVDILYDLPDMQKLNVVAKYLAEKPDFLAFLAREFADIVKSNLKAGDLIEYDGKLIAIAQVNARSFTAYYVESGYSLWLGDTFDKLTSIVKTVYHRSEDDDIIDEALMEIPIKSYTKIENVYVAEIKGYFDNGKPRKSPDLVVAIDPQGIKGEKIRMKSIPITVRLERWWP